MKVCGEHPGKEIWLSITMKKLSFSHNRLSTPSTEWNDDNANAHDDAKEDDNTNW